MSEEEILDLAIEPENQETELRQIAERACRALAYAEEGKSDMNVDRCRACEDAYGEIDYAVDELFNMEAEIESHADSLVDWQNWEQAWKDEALELIKRFEPERLSEEEEAADSAPKDLARLNKEPNRSACASCGGQLKEPWAGLKHCPVCEP